MESNKSFNWWVLLFGTLYLWSKYDTSARGKRGLLIFFTLITLVPVVPIILNIYLAIKNNAAKYVDTTSRTNWLQAILAMVFYVAVFIAISALQQSSGAPDCDDPEAVSTIQKALDSYSKGMSGGKQTYELVAYEKLRENDSTRKSVCRYQINANESGSGKSLGKITSTYLLSYDAQGAIQVQSLE